jgi:phosphate transport system substrate-binding protein
MAGISGCGSSSLKLQGAGASFPAPLYNKWFKDYASTHPGVQVEYQSQGSGVGKKAVQDHTVDFGASDSAMTEEQMGKVKGGVVLLPMTAGSIVLVFNVEGVKELKLPRAVYPDIFLGKITKWNDPAIAKANPDVQLPNKTINVVVRLESSGTTFVFTKHLAAISPAFAKSPGVHELPAWPVGSKAKGNEGVTNAIKTTPGSFGYVEYGYARDAKLPMALLENKEGNFVAASTASGQVALASEEIPANRIAWAPDPAGKDAYPIVTFTWMIFYKHYDDAKKAEALRDVVNYCLSKGQESAEAMGYIPLPAKVIEINKEGLKEIQGGVKAALRAFPIRTEPLLSAQFAIARELRVAEIATIRTGCKGP